MQYVPPVSDRTALVCASAATLLGALGLLGWLTPWRALASLDPASVPMAPSTALVLLLLSGALILEARRRSIRATTEVSLLVSFISLVQLARFAAGLPPILDAFLVGDPAAFGGVPTGRISPLTAFGLLLASLSLLCIGLSSRRGALGIAGGGLALGVCVLGSVVTLGYLYGTPLLYGGSVVPMAFSTALAMGCLGLALVGLSPRDSGPLRPFTGSSARAMLLRAFLPVGPVVLVVDLLIDQINLSSALAAAVTGLVSAIVVSGIVTYTARGVGRELEHSRRDADRLAALVRSSSDAIYAKSLDGTIVAWNASAERLFGYTQAEALGRSAKMLVPPGSGDEWANILERIGNDGRIDHKETDRERKDGSHVLVALSESPLRDASGRVVGVSVIARNVSEQRRAEKALLESEAKLRAFFESSLVGIVFGDVHGSIEDANEEFLRIVGYTRDDLRTGLRWNALTPAEFMPLNSARVAEARQRGACEPYEKQYIRKDGRRVWALVGYIFLGPERQQSVAFVLDIDARRQAEDLLRKSDERFAKVFHSSLIAIGIAEVSTGRFIDVNGRCADLFGYTRDEMVGHTVFELGLWANPADRDRLVAGSSSQSASSGEVALRQKSGEIRHALLSMEAMTLAGIAEPLNMVVLVDMTEHRRLESQLLQAQKMEAIGRLAAGVAHDFNNSLGVILGYTELLMRKASEAQRAKLEQIVKVTERASRLTHQLLAFSRKEIVDPKVLDLNALLSDLEKMLVRLIGEDVDLVIVPGVDLGQVKADPGQLEQVVMNLCVNARDAMPDGGLLRIETANIEVDAGHAAGPELMAPGPYVMLAVRDAGCGIEKEILPNIFEPFFTTKERGKGTGLGLAMVYGIARQAGGYVGVDSEVGRGTTFKIYLPRIDEPVVRVAPEGSMPAKGWETILLVEDEEPLREITREILEEHGYRVIEATGASAAVDIARRLPEHIHLLVTDVVMPGMNGRALAESLVAARPGLKVLYMSGYTDDVIAQRGVLESGTHLLEKPFTALALLQRVRKTLEEQAAGANA
jgi:two-component system, cell cycle sensor histidine kinase and response regulator CckA